MEKLIQSVADKNPKAIADGDVVDRDPFAEPNRAPACAGTTTAFLAMTAHQIRDHLARCRSESIAPLLAEAKERVDQRPWLYWLRHQFGWSETTALKLIQRLTKQSHNPVGRLTSTNCSQGPSYGRSSARCSAIIRSSEMSVERG